MTEQIDFDDLTAKLIRVRDKIDEIEEQHKTELKPWKEMKAKLENIILSGLTDLNAKNISTTRATVSVLSRKSASLEDPAAFMDYVIGNNAWDLLDRKANSKAVEDFIEEHGVQPPGVKFSAMQVLGLRRK